MPLTPTAVEPPVLFSLGKYDVVRKLATGGMAEIFLARVRDHVTQGRRYVVLKRMLPQLLAQQEFVDMFVDEARIAAALTHPHIVRTYDVGVADGQHYIAMEYLHGEDLRTIMRTLRGTQRRMPRELSAYIVSLLCEALHYAHEAVGLDGKPMEIVHRDVSPQNVVVGYDGAVALLDFGIARSAGRVGETKLGMLKGKIGYMSPEQCRGEPLDGRSDVFAAAILLYELSTGRRLYKAQSEFEALKLVVEGSVPPPRELDEDYPEELERIVLRGLAKDPRERFQSGREMQQALEDFGREHKLRMSSLALSDFMEETFGAQAAAWRQAQRDGKDLDQYLREHAEVLRYPADGALTRLSPDEDNGVAQHDSGVGVAAFAAQLAREVEANQRSAGDAGAATATGDGAKGGGAPARDALQTQRVPPLERTKESAPAGPQRIAMILVGVFALVAGASAALAFVLLRDRMGPAGGTAKAGLGVLEVASRPPGATLFLDGSRIAERTPATIDRVTMDETHMLLMQLPGHRDVMRSFVMPPTRVLKLRIELEPDDDAAIGHAIGNGNAKAIGNANGNDGLAGTEARPTNATGNANGNANGNGSGTGTGTGNAPVAAATVKPSAPKTVTPAKKAPAKKAPVRKKAVTKRVRRR